METTTKAYLLSKQLTSSESQRCSLGTRPTAQAARKGHLTSLRSDAVLRHGSAARIKHLDVFSIPLRWPTPLLSGTASVITLVRGGRAQPRAERAGLPAVPRLRRVLSSRRRHVWSLTAGGRNAQRFCQNRAGHSTETAGLLQPPRCIAEQFECP